MRVVTQQTFCHMLLFLHENKECLCSCHLLQWDPWLMQVSSDTVQSIFVEGSIFLCDSERKIGIHLLNRLYPCFNGLSLKLLMTRSDSLQLAK